MAWILDTYTTFKNGSELDAAGCVTGMPVHQSGIQGRTEATGRGVFYGLKEMCDDKDMMKELGMDLGIAGKTMVIQGMGNVGSYAGLISQNEGDVKVIAVSELEGTIYDPSGLDMDKLIKYRKKNETIIGFGNSKELKVREDWVGIECDILVPAALESQIHKGNAKQVKAKIVAEAANGPVTSEAEVILNKNGVCILPDMYLNAGGVTVSYFEWLKNLSHMRFGRMEKRFNQNTYNKILTSVEELTGKTVSARDRAMLIKGADEVDLVRSGLEETMITSYQQFIQVYKRRKNITDLRTAAFVCALNKVANDYTTLGVFP